MQPSEGHGGLKAYMSREVKSCFLASDASRWFSKRRNKESTASVCMCVSICKHVETNTNIETWLLMQRVTDRDLRILQKLHSLKEALDCFCHLRVLYMYNVLIPRKMSKFKNVRLFLHKIFLMDQRENTLSYIIANFHQKETELGNRT